MNKGCLGFPYICFATVVCLLSAVAFGLGIADVVIGVVGYYNRLGCDESSTASPVCTCAGLKLTWVATGIWSSIPLFVSGVFAFHVKRCNVDNVKQRRNVMFLWSCFLGSLIFGPAMTIISSVEVYEGTNVFYTVPPEFNATASPLLSGREKSDVAKLAVPLSTAVLGAVLTLLSVMALVWRCCACLPCVQFPRAHSVIYEAQHRSLPERAHRSCLDEPHPFCLMGSTPFDSRLHHQNSLYADVYPTSMSVGRPSSAVYSVPPLTTGLFYGQQRPTAEFAAGPNNASYMAQSRVYSDQRRASMDGLMRGRNPALLVTASRPPAQLQSAATPAQRYYYYY